MNIIWKNYNKVIYLKNVYKKGDLNFKNNKKIF